jgi:hypothetical protein
LIWRKTVKLLTSSLKLLLLSWKMRRQSWNELRRRRNWFFASWIKIGSYNYYETCCLLMFSYWLLYSWCLLQKMQTTNRTTMGRNARSSQEAWSYFFVEAGGWSYESRINTYKCNWCLVLECWEWSWVDGTCCYFVLWTLWSWVEKLVATWS